MTAFFVLGSWLHLKGLEITGVQVTITNHTQSECFENQGNNNIYEQLVMHDGQAIGIYCLKGANSLFLNCDAYRNWDYTSEDHKGGNVDGFGCHVPKGGTNNIFRGCRAWFNSDDGYDCINCSETPTFDNCWSFYNGDSTNFASLGDGNGFKGGAGRIATDPAAPNERRPAGYRLHAPGAQQRPDRRRNGNRFFLQWLRPRFGGLRPGLRIRNSLLLSEFFMPLNRCPQASVLLTIAALYG